MKGWRIGFLWMAGLCCILLSGCADSRVKEQAAAIEELLLEKAALPGTFHFMTFSSIKSQLMRQDRQAKKEAKEQGEAWPAEEDIHEAEYVIQVIIPDFRGYSLADLEIEPPVYSVSENGLSDYQEAYEANIADALRKRISQGEIKAFRYRTLTMELVKNRGNWEAQFAGTDVGKVSRTIRTDLKEEIEKRLFAEEDYQILEYAEKINMVFEKEFDVAEFSNSIVLEEVVPSGDFYTVTLRYADADLLYTHMEEKAFQQLVTSGQGVFEPFTSDSAQMVLYSFFYTTLEETQIWERRVLQLEEKPWRNRELREIIERANEVRLAHQESFLIKLNEEYVSYSQSFPETGVLSGENTGQSVKVVTLPTAMDVYLRVYSLSTQFLGEQGELVLTAFIRSGEPLQMKLPPGYYKLNAGVGEIWYGEPHAFGPEGVYGDTDLLMEVEEAHSYTLELNGVQEKSQEVVPEGDAMDLRHNSTNQE